MKAAVSSLSPFYSIQNPNPWVMMPTVGGSYHLNEPYLEPLHRHAQGLVF